MTHTKNPPPAKGGQPTMKPLFPLGRVVTTSAVARKVPPSVIRACLARHNAGDWGDLSAGDKAENTAAVAGRGQLLSAFETPAGRLWVITEGDRSVTTVHFPEER